MLFIHGTNSSGDVFQSVRVLLMKTLPYSLKLNMHLKSKKEKNGRQVLLKSIYLSSN